jgi:hypothetical protein
MNLPASSAPPSTEQTFKDGGNELTITGTIGNGTHFKAYNGKRFVNVPRSQHDTVDGIPTELVE